MTRVKRKIENALEKAALMTTKAVFFGAISLFFIYAFVVGSVTVLAVNVSIDEKRTKDLVSEISELEIEYLNKEKGIDQELAGSLGFKLISNPHFVSINSSFASRETNGF